MVTGATPLITLFITYLVSWLNIQVIPETMTWQYLKPTFQATSAVSQNRKLTGGRRQVVPMEKNAVSTHPNAVRPG